MKVFQDIPLPNFSDLFPAKPKALNRDFIYTGSGKASLSLILKYLKSKEIITMKSDEVLVPKWLGYWVYNQINQHCMTSPYLSPETKVVLLYHQFGIPQDRVKWEPILKAKNYIVIEDCAHQLRPLDQTTEYDFTIFSFSKFFFCFAFGGLITWHKDFIIFAEKEVSLAPLWKTSLINFVKYLNESARHNGTVSETSLLGSLLASTYSWYGTSFKYSKMSYALFSNKFEKELNLRNKRFQTLRDTFLAMGRVSYLKDINTSPYAFPLDVTEEEASKIIPELNKLGFRTGKYTFDRNRFFLEPDYCKVILLYLHSDIPDSDFDKQISTCQNFLKDSL